jgi:hypothetical protein
MAVPVPMAVPVQWQCRCQSIRAVARLAALTNACQPPRNIAARRSSTRRRSAEVRRPRTPVPEQCRRQSDGEGEHEEPRRHQLKQDFGGDLAQARRGVGVGCRRQARGAAPASQWALCQLSAASIKDPSSRGRCLECLPRHQNPRLRRETLLPSRKICYGGEAVWALVCWIGVTDRCAALRRP